MTEPQTLAAHAIADEKAIRRRGLTLALLTTTYFFSYMDRQILAILQELIKADLQLSDTQLGLLSGLAFALFYATLGIPVARLADRFNRKNIVALSLAAWSAMTAVGGLAQNFTQLLLARIGVGIGEAGSSPPSHSIIADLYPPDRRAGAMGVFSLGVVLGSAIGTSVGGLVAAAFGWRTAMYVIGMPGVVLALIVWLFVVEPRRGLSDPNRAPDAAKEPMPSLAQGFASLAASGPALHLVAGVTLTSMIGYGLTAWGPSYMQRSLGIGVRDISLYVALPGGLFGIASAVGGGKIADWLARRHGLHAQSTMVAVLKTLALPFTLGFFLFDQPVLAIGSYFLYILFANSYLGPTFALIQGLAPLRLRALWAAITLLVINLIGLGAGPTLVGVISDLLKPSFGEDSLRWSMMLFAAVTPWAIFHYWRAGVLLKRAG
ncbi:spinster family MFS transporter [Sphingomonas qomolangmaensis]|uniref:MFS transporter n=1 Tax=Sphingomonas qomolangmaensis TaxID=2918765 RepID=A0ABY5L8P4_9SPHN|nr:MFS transporter [Sphingomonas qomolangmaensis]UUL83350.1 MFS transporter [Sphingomonas qomolangmaensis]